MYVGMRWVEWSELQYRCNTNWTDARAGVNSTTQLMIAYSFLLLFRMMSVMVVLFGLLSLTRRSKHKRKVIVIWWILLIAIQFDQKHAHHPQYREDQREVQWGLSIKGTLGPANLSTVERLSTLQR